MKATALVDFVAKMMPPLEDSEPVVDEWQLWADEAYRARGSGIRILLQS